MENWGPYYIVPAKCRKSECKKVRLCESLDADLLRQELITNGLPLEVVRITNPWLYRRKGAKAWSMIGESDDIENDFPVEWDISGLASGTYELMGTMRATVVEGTEESALESRPPIREVQIAK